MARKNSLTGVSLAVLGSTIGGAQAYYVRQLAPGWPPSFHAQPTKSVDMVQIPVDRLQFIGLVLVLAILCLIAVVLSVGRTKR